MCVLAQPLLAHRRHTQVLNQIQVGGDAGPSAWAASGAGWEGHTLSARRNSCGGIVRLLNATHRCSSPSAGRGQAWHQALAQTCLSAESRPAKRAWRVVADRAAGSGARRAVCCVLPG
jgi:hypothetical protein